MNPAQSLLARIGLVRLVLPALLLGGVAAKPASLARETIPFDAGWRFQLGDEARAAQPNFDDASWRTLDVPHEWSIEGSLNPPPEGDSNGGFFSHGIGWYRKSFTLPAAATGRKVVV